MLSAMPISIHTLRVESDAAEGLIYPMFDKFQSTLSVWRVTAMQAELDLLEHISIHTLRVESDIWFV